MKTLRLVVLIVILSWAGLSLWGPSDQPSPHPSSAQQQRPAPPPALGERTIRFPADFSLGVLKVRSWGELIDRPYFDHGIAQGEVRVPGGRELALWMRNADREKLLALHSLQPDDVQILSIARKWIAPNPERIVFGSDLAVLAKWTTLRDLRIGPGAAVGIGDEDMKHLRHLDSLVNLEIGSLQITDTGLGELGGLVSLERLALWSPQITDDGLGVLKSFPSLRILSLTNAQITDAGLNRLRTLESLEYLALDGTQVTDDGLRALESFPSLRTLSLRNTQISDAGLKHLKSLKSLESLLLQGTQVSKKAISRLQRSLPNCWIPPNNFPPSTTPTPRRRPIS